MIVIGMFHNRKDPEKVTRAYVYASIAKMESIEFFFFSSKRVDFKRKIINGLVYENNQWIEKEYNFPDIIINTVNPLTRNQAIIYKKLKKMIPFTSHPVGTKLTVYNKIKKSKKFQDYLLPYKKIKTPIDVLKFLNIYSKIIIKPILGKHGNNVIYIESNNNSFIINDGITRRNISRIELYDYLSNILVNTKMLAQKYIKCKTKLGEPYDIRLHVQKDGEGKWKNTVIYPKVGFKNKIATNLAQGGQITILNNFLYREFNNQYLDIKKYLEVFAIQFANHFDTLYKDSFDELGIDIGLDEDNKIWIYEVNWHPGHLYIELKAAKLAIQYAKYLAMKTKKGDANEKNKH